MYVPAYAPAVVFFAHAPLFFPGRFLIGPWLNTGFDWRAHRIYYHGWEHGPAWVERSRPFIHINGVYVNNRYHNVYVNRDVVNHRVNYRALNRYDGVHRQTNFDRYRGVGHGGPMPPPPPNQVVIRNKVIERNFNTSDPRLNEFRGHAPRAPEVRAPGPSAFAPTHGGFGTNQESHRGQASRSIAAPPPPPRSQPAPPRSQPPPQPRHEERRH